MRQIGFHLETSAAASEETTEGPDGVRMPRPTPSSLKKVSIGSDQGGASSLTLHEEMGLQQAALWLGEAGARNPQLLSLLRSIASNAITIAMHVPPDHAETTTGRQVDQWELALVETREGVITLEPQEDSEIKLAVWNLGLASARDSSALGRFSKLLESAENLAELITQAE